MAIGDPNAIVRVEKPPQIRSPIDSETPGRKTKTKDVMQPGEYIISKAKLRSPNIQIKDPDTGKGVNIIPVLGAVHVYG